MYYTKVFKSLSRKTSLHDADPNIFHGRPNAWRLFGMLSVDEEVTVKELVTATGLTLATVRRNLKFLAEHGLAYRIDTTTWRGTAAAPDKSAPAPDGIDYKTSKHQKHIEQRNHHRMWLDVRRAYRDKPDEAQEFASRRLEEECWNPDESIPAFDPETGEIVNMESSAEGGSAAVPIESGRHPSPLHVRGA